MNGQLILCDCQTKLKIDLEDLCKQKVKARRRENFEITFRSTWVDDKAVQCIYFYVHCTFQTLHAIYASIVRVLQVIQRSNSAVQLAWKVGSGDTYSLQ